MHTRTSPQIKCIHFVQFWKLNICVMFSRTSVATWFPRFYDPVLDALFTHIKSLSNATIFQPASETPSSSSAQRDSQHHHENIVIIALHFISILFFFFLFFWKMTKTNRVIKTSMLQREWQLSTQHACVHLDAHFLSAAMAGVNTGTIIQMREKKTQKPIKTHVTFYGLNCFSVFILFFIFI